MKVTIYSKETGERLERWPIDARELIRSGEYTMEKPVSAPSDEQLAAEAATRIEEARARAEAEAAEERRLAEETLALQREQFGVSRGGGTNTNAVTDESARERTVAVLEREEVKVNGVVETPAAPDTKKKK